MRRTKSLKERVFGRQRRCFHFSGQLFVFNKSVFKVVMQVLKDASPDKTKECAGERNPAWEDNLFGDTATEYDKRPTADTYEEKTKGVGAHVIADEKMQLSRKIYNV